MGEHNQITVEEVVEKGGRVIIRGNAGFRMPAAVSVLANLIDASSIKQGTVVEVHGEWTNPTSVTIVRRGA